RWEKAATGGVHLRRQVGEDELIRCRLHALEPSGSWGGDRPAAREDGIRRRPERDHEPAGRVRTALHVGIEEDHALTPGAPPERVPGEGLSGRVRVQERDAPCPIRGYDIRAAAVDGDLAHADSA